jgi:hypothetical protein
MWQLCTYLWKKTSTWSHMPAMKPQFLDLWARSLITRATELLQHPITKQCVHKNRILYIQFVFSFRMLLRSLWFWGVLSTGTCRCVCYATIFCLHAVVRRIFLPSTIFRNVGVSYSSTRRHIPDHWLSRVLFFDKYHQTERSWHTTRVDLRTLILWCLSDCDIYHQS